MKFLRKACAIMLILVLSVNSAFFVAASNELDLDRATVFEIQEMVREGSLSYLELTQMFLERIELFDGILNSVIAVNPGALQAAAEADAAVALNPDLARGMFGIPVLLKDNINFIGLPTTGGALALAENMAEFNAALVENLLDAGAIILGKTNLSELAGVVVHIPAFSAAGGLTVNVFDVNASPAGSSSGSAVAAAAALAAVTVGTETTGSIQNPAGAAQIAAIKPTVSLVSAHGIIPIAQTRDTAGPMARNITDAAILLNALAGGETDFTQSLRTDGLEGIRVGIVSDIFGDVEALSADALANFNMMTAALEQAGVVIVLAEDGGFLQYDMEDPLTHLGAATINMLYEFVIYMDEFLAAMPQGFPIRSVAELHAFNAANPEAIPQGQLFLDTVMEQDLSDIDAVMAGIAATRDAAAANIDNLLAAHNLDALMTVNMSADAAVAGYPVVTIPLFFDAADAGASNNAVFFGTAFTEALLIEIAFVAEQGTNFRVTPSLVFPDGEQEADIVPGAALVPVRAAFEAIGFDVGWDADAMQVTLTGSDFTIVLTIGSEEISIDGESLSLASSVILLDGVTFAPIQFLLDAIA